MKIFYILDDGLKEIFKENLKQVTALSYSDGGNFLAVANLVTSSSSNQSAIFIFDSYTQHQLKTLNGHSTQIKELTFCESDIILMSVCQHGVLYTWDLLKENEKIIDHPMK